MAKVEGRYDDLRKYEDDQPIPEDQPKAWRCMVEGCRIQGVLQPVLPGERYYPPHHPRSHYWQEHYIESEREYRRKLEEQREERLAHYRLTGEFLPPRV